MDLLKEDESSIVEFPIGLKDFSNKFQIPKKLYGKEKDIEILLDSFQRLNENGKKELILVAGYSGIGKSENLGRIYDTFFSTKPDTGTGLIRSSQKKYHSLQWKN